MSLALWIYTKLNCKTQTYLSPFHMPFIYPGKLCVCVFVLYLSICQKCMYIIFVLSLLSRARKDSEVTLDANKYMSLVRVLSKHGRVEG